MLITANNNNFNDTQKHNSCQTIDSNSGPKNNQRGLEMYLQQQQQQQLLSCESLENIGLFASRRGVTIYLYAVELCFMYIFLYLYCYCFFSSYCYLLLHFLFFGSNFFCQFLLFTFLLCIVLFCNCIVIVSLQLQFLLSTFQSHHLELPRCICICICVCIFICICICIYQLWPRVSGN